ncbi:MAG TPA: hotdog fold thioesterase [Chitinophagaceae bacterium]|nr:hotdog fold thioesterase [Chitinophagaceae bacterium]
MKIWFDKDISLEKIEPFGKNTMSEHLGIEWTEIGNDFLKAKMPVDHRTKQPFDLLHGGASCVLAETLGSFASYLVLDPAEFYCVGIEINANHIRSARSGFVHGICSPLHVGSSTHVWDIRITNEERKLVCISRLTVAIMKKKTSG